MQPPWMPHGPIRKMPAANHDKTAIHVENGVSAATARDAAVSSAQTQPSARQPIPMRAMQAPPKCQVKNGQACLPKAMWKTAQKDANPATDAVVAVDVVVNAMSVDHVKTMATEVRLLTMARPSRVLRKLTTPPMRQLPPQKLWPMAIRLHHRHLATTSQRHGKNVPATAMAVSAVPVRTVVSVVITTLPLLWRLQPKRPRQLRTLLRHP